MLGDPWVDHIYVLPSPELQHNIATRKELKQIEKVVLCKWNLLIVKLVSVLANTLESSGEIKNSDGKATTQTK